MFFIIFIPILGNLKTGDFKYIYLIPIAIFIGYYIFCSIQLNFQYPQRGLKGDDSNYIKEVVKKFDLKNLKITILDTCGQKFANLFAAGITSLHF